MSQVRDLPAGGMINKKRKAKKKVVHFEPSGRPVRKREKSPGQYRLKLRGFLLTPYLRSFEMTGSLDISRKDDKKGITNNNHI